jgi:hypothetical protein
MILEKTLETQKRDNKRISVETLNLRKHKGNP